MSEMMNTGDIGRRIGLAVTTELLDKIGVKPDGKDKRASLYNASRYPEICDKLGKWVAKQAGNPPVAAPPKKSKPTSAPPPAAAAGKPDDDEL